MRMRVLAATTVAAAALVAAGCGGDDSDEAATVTVTTGAPAAPAPESLPESTPVNADEATTADTQAAPARRTYRAGPAGTVTIAREAGGIRLVSVDPAQGWTHRVTEQEPDEIEIDFVSGSRAIDFEAELEGDRVRVKVEDDDD